MMAVARVVSDNVSQLSLSLCLSPPLSLPVSPTLPLPSSSPPYHTHPSGGEEAEFRFCDTKSLSMPNLRMTCEAKNQIRDILVSIQLMDQSQHELLEGLRELTD